MNRKRKFVQGPMGGKRQRVQPRSHSAPAFRNRGLKAEIKTLDVPTNAIVLSTTAVIAMLNGIQEGTSFFNRVGRKIMMKSLRFTASIYMNGTQQATAGDYARVMLIYDRQPNGNYPAIGDILADVDNAGNVTTNSQSGLNMNNSERFQVLRDHRFGQIGPDTGAALTNASLLIGQGLTEKSFLLDYFIKLKDIQTHYKSTSNPAVIGDITTGSLLLVTLGANVVANAQWSMSWKSRVRFTDV